MRARKNAAAEAGENERGSAPHRCVCAHRHAQPPRGTQRVALGASKRRRARSHRFRTRATAVIVCAFTGNMCPGKKRVDQAFVCKLGRKLVAIQTEARCPKSNTWSTPPSRDDCSRPSSRHVAAGREHDSKKCRTPSSLCREPSRCALAFRLGRLRRRHYQRGRQQDFVPGMRVPRSGLPRVFDSALAYISMQTTGGRCICTSSCLTRAKHSWRTCRISAAITDTCTATTAGSVHTATVRYQNKPPHTHRSGEGSA